MDALLEMLPLLIPILVLDAVLAVAAALHVLRHPHSLVGLGNIKKTIGGFSRGMKQRLGIAQALLGSCLGHGVYFNLHLPGCAATPTPRISLWAPPCDYQLSALGKERDPRKVVRLCGERRSNEVSETCRLRRDK